MSLCHLLLSALDFLQHLCVGHWKKTTHSPHRYTQLRSMGRVGTTDLLGQPLSKGRESVNVSPCCCWVVWILKDILGTHQRAPAGFRMERTLAVHGSNQRTFISGLFPSLFHIPPSLLLPRDYLSNKPPIITFLFHTLLLKGTPD